MTIGWKTKKLFKVEKCPKNAQKIENYMEDPNSKNKYIKSGGSP